MDALFANVEDRTIRGVVLPYDEASRLSVSGTEPIMFSKGSVSIPRDPTMVGLNVMHDRFTWAGRVSEVDDTDAGLVATFKVADTEEGDEALAAVAAGRLTKLSAEVTKLVRDGARAVSARLSSVALVDEGAFASAALFALGETVDVEQLRGADPEEDEEEETPDEAPATPETEPDGEPDEDEEEAVGNASATEVMLAGRSATPKKKDELTFRGFAHALFAMHTAGDAAGMQAYMRFGEQVGLFELADVKYDGTGGLNANGQITGPAYLGELWEATPDVRTFIPAVGSGSLTALTATGWNVAVPDGAVATWAGNKTDIPSAEATVTPLTFTAQRFAGGNDIAREFFDFGHTEVIESWARKMVQLYMKKSDAYALTQVLAGAATATPGTVPSGADAGLTAIIDLAMQVYAAGGTPNVIRVAPNLYRTMLLALDGNQFAYLGAQLGLQQGDVDGLDIRPDARLAASQLLVLDRNGVGVWELPGSPIRVDAVSVVNGGYDRAFFGYIAAGVIESPVVLKATLS